MNVSPAFFYVVIVVGLFVLFIVLGGGSFTGLRLCLKEAERVMIHSYANIMYKLSLGGWFVIYRYE